MTAKKISSHFDKGEVHVLHKGIWNISSNYVYTPGFLGILRSKCRIDLKLFLRHAIALCEATARFEIFLNWFDTFSSLIEFSRDFTM
jgi:hypothetical protein